MLICHTINFSWLDLWGFEHISFEYFGKMDLLKYITCGFFLFFFFFLFKGGVGRGGGVFGDGLAKEFGNG